MCSNLSSGVIFIANVGDINTAYVTSNLIVYLEKTSGSICVSIPHSWRKIFFMNGQRCGCSQPICAVTSKLDTVHDEITIRRCVLRNGAKHRRNAVTSAKSSDFLRLFQVCAKVFGNASALAKHKLTHSDERKYVCTMCGKAFKRQDHL